MPHQIAIRFFSSLISFERSSLCRTTMAPSNSRVSVERRWASIHWLMNSAGLSVSSGSAGSWASSSLLHLHLSFSCSNPIFSASTPTPITDVRVWASLNSLYSAPLAGDALIQLYHDFITDFETKINLLKLAHFAVIVSQQYSEKEAGISYLHGIIEKLQATKEQRIEEPILYIRMQIAMFKLEQGEQKECIKLLEDGKSTLDSMTDIDPSVYASFYWVSSQYHKFRQEFSEFYKAALLYLAYASVESLSELFKLDLAFDLSLSALLGDNIYNFGELLAHPIPSMRSLRMLFQRVSKVFTLGMALVKGWSRHLTEVDEGALPVKKSYFPMEVATMILLLQILDSC